MTTNIGQQIAQKFARKGGMTPEQLADAINEAFKEATEPRVTDEMVDKAMAFVQGYPLSRDYVRLILEAALAAGRDTGGET